MQLNAFLHEKEVCNDKKSVSKTEMVMRVLISNADKPLSVDEFAEEYYKYIERRGYPVERLKINLRTVGNHLRNARGIVFNRDNKVRFCDADPHIIWQIVDFSQYRNTVILIKFSIDFPPVNSYLLFSTSVPAVDLDFSANLTYQFLEMGGKPF